MKCAVVVLGTVGGEEIREIGMAFVVVEATGEPAEIGIAAELDGAVLFLNAQMNLVTEAERFAVAGVEPGEVIGFVLLGDDAAELVIMAVRVAFPGAFPAALEVDGRGGIFRGDGPFMTEGSATSGGEQGNGNGGEPRQLSKTTSQTMHHARKIIGNGGFSSKIQRDRLNAKDRKEILASYPQKALTSIAPHAKDASPLTAADTRGMRQLR